MLKSKNILFITLLGILFSCNKKETKAPIEYETIDSAIVIPEEKELTPKNYYPQETITSYEKAERENTSYGWKRFLEENPNHPNKKEISEKIIRLEVDEISGDYQTGQMPSFDNYSTNHSSTSTVKITNNTGCELTVRYSGAEAKVLYIPKEYTKTIVLKSGYYKIAASACGANYAGSENLHGDYGSTFYISRQYSY